MATRKPRGNVLVEAVIVFGLIFSALILNLELARRAFYEILLHHGSFLLARSTLFSGEERGRAVASRFWKRAWPAFRATQEVEFFPAHLSARVHAEYPAWLRFPWHGGTKKGFEVTRRCRFYFSR